MEKEKYFGLSPRIARWKLDTPIENWLSRKADHSLFFKQLYLLYYYMFDRKYYLVGRQMAKKAFTNHVSSEGVSDINAVVNDMVYCLHRFGISFQDYCIYDFVNNKDFDYRNSFVSDKLRYHYCDLLNSKEVYQIMTDKYACYQKFEKFFIRKVVGCFTDKDVKEFLDFVTAHSLFIYKPLEEHSGHGVEIFDSQKINPNKFFREKLACGSFVVEELIEQGKEVACMHPQSVNSCRVLTFTDGQKVRVIGTTWRVGSGDAIKDNAGAGGMYAYINPKTGVVETDAINYYGKHYKHHPDSDIRFEGFQMPQWDEAMETVRQMATNIKGSTLIAWDMAFSTKGWVMVEANENGDWSIIQSNKKIGLKQQLLSYMDEYLRK